MVLSWKLEQAKCATSGLFHLLFPITAFNSLKSISFKSLAQNRAQRVNVGQINENLTLFWMYKEPTVCLQDHYNNLYWC